MQIALLTQDNATQALIVKLTAANGYACTRLVLAKPAIDVLQREACDALIVDVSAAQEITAILPWIRSHLPPSFPVIALLPAALDIIADAVNHGVTDYLVKPLRQGELALRLRVALQRAYPDRFDRKPLIFGDYVFDEGSHTLTVKDQPMDLTQKEFALALLFFRHLNRPLSRAFIVEKIWSRELEVSSRTVDTHVSRVRNKLDLKPQNGFKLMPVYSFGYRLEQFGASVDASKTG